MELTATLELILTGVIFILGTFLTIYMVGYTKKMDQKFNLLKPADPEDAKRLTLHELECFCPPSWGRTRASAGINALSELYKHLQYASRGHSFIITRAAVWKMLDLIKTYAREEGSTDTVLTEKLSMQLYVYKTMVASAIGNQMQLPLDPNREQREYHKILEQTIAHTSWAVDMYIRMNNDPKPIDDPDFSLKAYCETSLNEFKDCITVQ